MEVITDARMKPPAEPQTDKTDAMIELLTRISQQLEMLFWASGGPMAAQANQQLYLAYHPDQRPEKPKIVVPS